MTGQEKKRKRTLSVCSHTIAESPFRQMQVNCSIILPPVYIGRVQQGVQEILNARLLKYDDRLGGVLLCYSDTKLKEGYGRVFNELPELSYIVTFKALVFATLKDMRLVGKVNKITAGHIGLLVCGAFQVSISSDDIDPRYKHSPSKSRWISTKDKKDVIKENGDVWFKVKQVQTHAGAWHIQGSILESSLGMVKS